MNRPIGILDSDRNRLLIHDGDKVWTTSEKSAGASIDGQLDLLANRDKGIEGQEVFGDGVFDFRYGPVTGGVIESGAYHLFTYGERILCANIDWGYKHRGIEKSMITLSVHDAVSRAEDICGNFAFAHSLAFAKAVESALGIEVSMQTKKLRIIGLELERIYNHIYVITQLASAAAQKVMTSHLQAIYEDLLRLNNDFFGSRFLKGFNGIAATRKPINIEALIHLSRRLNDLSDRFDYLYKRALESENFMDRLHDTAKLDSEKAMTIGVTGPTLRATGVREDFRLHDPDYEGLRCATSQMGDSLARMEVRAEEVFESVEIISDTAGELRELSDSGIEPVEQSRSGHNGTGSGIGYCESPSGLLAYHVEIEKGKLASVYAATPSLFGFKAIAESLLGNIFTDFPFAVDSFGAYFADAAR
ncbi:MAG: Ni,Fe-hydrogenase III large subunit [Bacteroidetes bacterium]|nr:Ni,Fe-hydrogenase III large subunit [Bacteroidota bacterium]